MSDSIAPAARILGRLWLEELTQPDLALIDHLPELAQSLTTTNTAADLDGLAVEYQRLFGFNLPPYESVFVDPSAMLMAPATERVQRLYRRHRWPVPQNFRTGAPDHIGLELMALATWRESGNQAAAGQLLTEHLAWWTPPLILALHRLNPHPFYATLADLTLALVLVSLPQRQRPGTLFDSVEIDAIEINRPGEEEEPEVRLRDVVKRLLPPRATGLFISREDIARTAQALKLPVSMGDRFKMLEGLFRQAGEYDQLPALLDQLSRLVVESSAAYQAWAREYPTWLAYAQVWQEQLASTQTLLQEMKTTMAQDDQPAGSQR